MTRARFAGWTAAALATLALTGCWDSYDVENNRYVSGLGFDRTGDQYDMYVQMIDFSYVARQEQGKSVTPAISYIGHGRGTTMDLAANDLYRTTQQRMFWSHISSILVTEAALKAGVQGLADSFDRFRETRYTQWVFGARTSIEPLFATADFFDMSALSTLLHEPTDNRKQRSWIAPIRWLQFCTDYLEPGKTIVLPTLDVQPNQWKRNRKPEPKLQIDGAFLIGDQTFKGWLSDEQLTGLRWVKTSTERTPLPVKDGDKIIGVLSMERPDVKIVETFANGNPRYRIKLKLKGTIIEMLDDATEEKLTRLGQAAVESEVRTTYREGLSLNADVYQLRYHTYLHHYAQWRQLMRQGGLQLDEDSLEAVDVELHIVSSGVLRDRPQ